jgi:hypothetical protein
MAGSKDGSGHGLHGSGDLGTLTVQLGWFALFLSADSRPVHTRTRTRLALLLPVDLAAAQSDLPDSCAGAARR